MSFDNDARIEVIDLVVRYGDVLAVQGVGFAIQPGELVTLLGPSGCGKTTTLRSIAGLEDPVGGTIRLNGSVAYSAEDRKNLPAEKRGLSMVFQSYAIWPHMTVAENVAYGLKVRKLPRAEVEQNVRRVLDLVQMTAYADRPASKLSGGQQQRIAVARAIAFSPNVLLFDEPLSNLDAKLRAEMRVELRELQRRLDITALYVTHDQEEALAISDRVIVMNHGRIEQIGSPEQVYNRPRSLFVADFVGAANLLPGRLRCEPDGAGFALFETEGGVLLRAQAWQEGPMPNGAERTVALRSAYIRLEAETGSSDPGPDLMNRSSGTIHRRMFHGDFIQYVVDWPAGQLIVRRPPTETIAENQKVRIQFAAEHCILLESGPASRSPGREA
jgi:iron(III) transport system ATP-binding protein